MTFYFFINLLRNNEILENHICFIYVNIHFFQCSKLNKIRCIGLKYFNTTNAYKLTMLILQFIINI